MSGSITVPYSGFVGLAVGGTEVSGGGYVREPVNLVTSADGTTICNDATIEWPIATADWGTIDHVQVWDAVTGGNLMVFVPTHEPVTIAQYSIARIADAGIPLVIAPARPRTYSMGAFGIGPYSVNVAELSPTTLGVPNGFGLGGFGMGPYGIGPEGVFLEITFDTSTHVCEPGTWQQGPFGWRQAA